MHSRLRMVGRPRTNSEMRESMLLAGLNGHLGCGEEFCQGHCLPKEWVASKQPLRLECNPSVPVNAPADCYAAAGFAEIALRSPSTRPERAPCIICLHWFRGACLTCCLNLLRACSSQERSELLEVSPSC
mmetsp:Transcript_169770/g.544854  ORF Transcript_169770/g.544854 Transcript_169770/m.544854 type:complete len:130 (+) Transcript_169770:759-1148(+)